MKAYVFYNNNPVLYWSVSKEFFAKKKISAKKILHKEKDAKKAKKNIP